MLLHVAHRPEIGRAISVKASGGRNTFHSSPKLLQ